tara:strand:+ start:22508 stop:22723 length:216 start_codon:yes stop_codon:yes gene_type:complete
MYSSMIFPRILSGKSDSSLIRRNQACIFTCLDPTGGSPGASAYVNRLSNPTCDSISCRLSDKTAITGVGIF